MAIPILSCVDKINSLFELTGLGSRGENKRSDKRSHVLNSEKPSTRSPVGSRSAYAERKRDFARPEKKTALNLSPDRTLTFKE